ncbi:MAG: DUF4920 domain-containing protein [Bacteroidia bacterium]|nr:DUF4920 domain-containing protein [Bacteroidia bacterium]NNF30309.1 DUF4920 domain-containing protein [Flavobacteriaceae bacterium]MBT8276385.1 DUF4920 domain-containing protein [Bacteroidia bacterium]NNJ80984.1 DUF4920 domain-containing protein [Flavobacteriaceae bacterium]NNK53546.1 DUF4920 domain-containing protein [Flavobacteriaceae bacterium]
MKKLLLLALALVILAACKTDKKNEEPVVEAETQEMAYQSFGEKITADNVLSSEELMEKYKHLNIGDSIAVKFTSEVKEVCQNKGCWMKMDMGEEEAMVRFKDYGFFMPKDIAGQKVIVDGYAFVTEMSVEDQRHYAEDAGKTAEEIATITEPKRTLSFTSSGVLIPEMEPAMEKQ